MAGKEFTVDLNNSRHFVHTPILTGGSPRFFESNFNEMMTRTVWRAVPVIWLPAAFYFIKMSYTMDLTLPLIFVLSVVGAFVWTFHEYCFHQFFFYLDTKSYWGSTFHYLIHGCHHKHPNDGLRLVRPPAVAAILAVMKYHLNHHSRIQNKGFGVPITLWDRALGTLPRALQTIHKGEEDIFVAHIRDL
ncbi:hypothetical protein F3Y22_tig00117026pilonHSYRG00115 [Hibiscus syriacus]|uniref:Fatty acid hydroxylase domain-containing protein n=1 Tax=Hibiscus syriacus TaxID=106335 RepID=A0A6A2WCK9_HIBSY|nr:hypothetical protein F3Y22_tig00117026pilonHSYRG00115 [Hibiscus syriacus]